MYGKDTQDLTAEEKGTISAIVGLAGIGIAASSGDVASTVQAGQVAQNAVENNYQTRTTLKIVNKQLSSCAVNDRACITAGINALRLADKKLDKALNACVSAKSSACVEQHLENILASDDSAEMQETLRQIKRLKISMETSGLLNETNGYSEKATDKVDAARAGQDIGCVSGTTKSCISAVPNKTMSERVGLLINDMTVRQIAAVVGAEYDPMTGEEITPNERQMAIASSLGLGFTKTVSGVTKLSDDVLVAIEKKYGKKVADKINADLMDSVTASGDTIRHSPTSTAIGDDTATINNFNNATNTGNGHNVIVHGQLKYDEIGGIPVINGKQTNIEQVAEAVRTNPDYVKGTPICFGSCWSGTSGTAQELANSLKVPVLAPTRPVAWDPKSKRWVMDTDVPAKKKLDYPAIKPEWKMFYPKN